MRFVVGPPPDSPDFAPEQEGWNRVRQPTPWTVVVLGSLIGLPLAAILAIAWSAMAQNVASITFNAGTSEWSSRFALPLIFLIAPLVFFGLLLLVHELVHLLACPGCGLTRQSILGIWPRKLMPYADHQGPVACWRFVIIALAPFVVLSLGPLVISLLIGATSLFWVLLSTFNAATCGGDAVLCWTVVSQVPLRAVVRNKGWDAWWRPQVPTAKSPG